MCHAGRLVSVMPTMILQHGGSVRLPLILSRRLYSIDSSVYNVIKAKALMVDDDFSLPQSDWEAR